MADVPGNATTGSTIAVGGTIDGQIETVGDHDWFKITLTAGQKVSIVVDIVTLEDPYVYIRNASGTVLGENDDGAAGRGSRLVFTAPANGTYYIDVAAWTPGEPIEGYTGTGSYKLSVSNYVAPSVGTLDEIAYQLTHGFFDGDFHRFDVTQGGTITVDLTALTDSGRAVAREALQQWSDIIGVNFVEQSGGAQITFDDLQQGTGAFAEAIHSNGIISSAIVNVSLQRLNLHTYMHEIGHALGIGHTSNSNAGTAAAVYPDDALWSNDGAAISIMSYFDNAENDYYADRGFSHVPIMTPQVADIIAMGNLYGLSTTTRTGNTTYGFNNSSGRDAFDATLHPNVAYTIFDSGGIDTLDYSGFASSQLIDLNPEAFSNIGSKIGNVVIARGTVIENAKGGSGADVIIGNAANNAVTGNGGNDTLRGNAGNDRLDGGAGYDRMYGGVGNDVYIVTDATDYAYENAGEGTDRVESSISHTLRVNVENLTLTGIYSNYGKGNDLANILTGNSGSNRLYGYAGDDRLIGGEGSDTLDGGSGLDKMFGGTGNDVYYADSTTDQMVEYAGEGIDTIQSSVTRALGANFERIYLTGEANINGTGNAEANLMKGNAGNNILRGGAGNDKLYGYAGADVLKGDDGNDHLEGGAGRDRFYGGAGADGFVFRDGDFSGTTSSTADQIHDFGDADGDRIRLNLVDADTTTANVNEAFAWLGTGAFTGTAGELRYEQIGANTFVQGDMDGDGAADFWIRLDGLHELGTDDFIF